MIGKPHHLPCDVDLQSGNFVVDAKSILGVLELPKKDTGVLQVYSDDPHVCTPFLEELEHLGILCPEVTNDSKDHISGMCIGRNAD